jgi:hypothetical protein
MDHDKNGFAILLLNFALKNWHDFQTFKNYTSK